MINFRFLKVSTLKGDRSPGSMTFCLQNDPAYNIEFVTEEHIWNEPEKPWYTEIQAGSPIFETLVGIEGHDDISILYPELFDALMKTNGRIVLNFCTEGFVLRIMPTLYRFIARTGIDPKKIYYASACSNLDELHTEYCEDKNIPVEKRINMLDYYDWFIAFYDDLRGDWPFIHSTKPRKRFINLNRRVRRHRVEMVSFLASRDLLKDGYVSFYHNDDLGFTATSVLDKIAKDESASYANTVTQAYGLLNGRPLSVDTFDSFVNPVGTNKFPYEEYRSADIDLVSETFFYEPERFLSEKAFRPICFKKPFILIASQGTLQTMRDLGFKTFHPHINEFYDRCEDPIERMQMILTEVDKLARLSDFDMNHLLKQINERVAFNYQHLLDNWNWLRNRFNGDPLYTKFKEDIDMESKLEKIDYAYHFTNLDGLNIGFVGVGKLGLPCAEVMAKKHRVEGYDVSEVESSLVKMVPSIKSLVKDKDIIFIAVPTSHHPDYDGSKPTSHLPPKDFDYSLVTKTLKDINKYATEDQLVVLISTVLPGTTRREFAHLITNARFIYNPYLIAMGSTAWDMVNPEMVIIGTKDGSYTNEATQLIDFYRTILNPTSRYEVGTWDEAEAIKIFYNTFISTKLTLVNMIQDVAQVSGNMDVDVVTNALARSSQRITSGKFMKAGMGDGGACHPRDNIALRWLSDELNLGYDFFGHIMESREKQAKNMADLLLSYHLPVVIVGKAYKPAVAYTDGSPSVLVGSFIEGKRDLYYYDPLTGDYPPEDLGQAVYLMAHSHETTYEDMEGVKKTKMDLEFSEDAIIIDPWRTMPMYGSPGAYPGIYTVIHYGNTRNIN